MMKDLLPSAFFRIKLESGEFSATGRTQPKPRCSANEFVTIATLICHKNYILRFESITTILFSHEIIKRNWKESSPKESDWKVKSLNTKL